MPGTCTTDVPAIAGGEPVKKTPFGRAVRYGEDELRELREALDRGSLFYAHGMKVRALEAAYAEAIGAPGAVACTSGTAAIHAALIAAGISPGDEVITSPITDMGTVIPILYQGAVPVFADLDPWTYNVMPESVEGLITPKTRALIAVHLAGNSCDLAALTELCGRRGLVLVEDCAQSHGCTYRGRSVGTFGDYGCFSLNEFKHISCGDGGLVVSRDPERLGRLRQATDKAYDRSPTATGHTPTFLAQNYRMTELQGAVGLAQLGKLDGIVAARRRWCGALAERLAGTPGLMLPVATPGCEHSWWLFMMRVVPDELGADADTFAQALQAEGIPVAAHYIAQCVYEYPVFVDHSAFERGSHPYVDTEYRKGLCPNAEAILDTCILLGVNEGYTDQDLEDTARAVRRVAEWYASGP